MLLYKSKIFLEGRESVCGGDEGVTRLSIDKGSHFFGGWTSYPG